MSEHSPEAEAAYPDDPNAIPAIRRRERTAFDKGRAVTLAATREALIEALYELRNEFVVMYGIGNPERMADAILAAGTILQVDPDKLRPWLIADINGGGVWGASAESVASCLLARGWVHP